MGRVKSNKQKCHVTPIYRYGLLPDQAYSAYSRPRLDHEDGSYEIHLIKSGNPLTFPLTSKSGPFTTTPS